jgi:hypothetical protein
VSDKWVWFSYRWTNYFVYGHYFLMTWSSLSHFILNSTLVSPPPPPYHLSSSRIWCKQFDGSKKCTSYFNLLLKIQNLFMFHNYFLLNFMTNYRIRTLPVLSSNSFHFNSRSYGSMFGKICSFWKDISKNLQDLFHWTTDQLSNLLVKPATHSTHSLTVILVFLL